ncbi:hypothetical protein [Streptomyces sp. NPDC051636]|uniref:hypothetical protein n=1 Tax=Streptomyces sp. NPDC051636 TaxID=3365663 RepID=UPI0037B4876B
MQALVRQVLRDEPALLRGYKPITNGGDRHGALEWVFHSDRTPADPMDRLASIGVIPQPATDTADFEFGFGEGSVIDT